MLSCKNLLPVNAIAVDDGLVSETSWASWFIKTAESAPSKVSAAGVSPAYVDLATIFTLFDFHDIG